MEKYKVGYLVMEKGGDSHYPDHDPLKHRMWEVFNTKEEAEKLYSELYQDFLNHDRLGFILDNIGEELGLKMEIMYSEKEDNWIHPPIIETFNE